MRENGNIMVQIRISWYLSHQVIVNIKYSDTYKELRTLTLTFISDI